MGKSGGFTFLIVYLLLAVFVGFIVMVSELAMGRKVGQGVIGCYTTLSKRFKWVGWLAVFSPFVVMSFYAVLGGYCIEYMALNLSTLAFPTELATGAELFDSMLTNPFGSILFTLLFLVICYLINRGGISGGIEKFNTVGMPALGGPSLLFVTLQDVFSAMGPIGPLFGVIFYLLVLIAAISSAISLIEVVVTFFLDRGALHGKKGVRERVVLIVCLAIMAEAALVAVDGLGRNGVPVPFQESAAQVQLSDGSEVALKDATEAMIASGTVKYAPWTDTWLDFMDMMSEGIAMPLGALLMSLMVGWEIRPKLVLEEVHLGSRRRIDRFYSLCIRFITPIGMVLVLLGQVNDFFALGLFV